MSRPPRPCLNCRRSRADPAGGWGQLDCLNNFNVDCARLRSVARKHLGKGECVLCGHALHTSPINDSFARIPVVRLTLATSRRRHCLWSSRAPTDFFGVCVRIPRGPPAPAKSKTARSMLICGLRSQGDRRRTRVRDGGNFWLKTRARWKEISSTSVNVRVSFATREEILEQLR
jgi:hypothetical protein